MSPVLEQNQLLRGRGWVVHVLFPASLKCLLTCSQDFANDKDIVKALGSLKTPSTETCQLPFFPWHSGWFF